MKKGLTVVEYCLIGAIIVLATIAAMQELGMQLNTILPSPARTLKN